MPARTNITGSSPGFVVDYNATQRSDGRQINWDDVDDARIPSGQTKKVIPAGTIMAEQPDGKIIPRADAAGGETAIGFLVSTCQEGALQDALSGYGMFVGGVFYEGLLPDREDGDFATWIGEIRDEGGSVVLQDYSDSSAAVGS